MYDIWTLEDFPCLHKLSRLELGSWENSRNLCKPYTVATSLSSFLVSNIRATFAYWISFAPIGQIFLLCWYVVSYKYLNCQACSYCLFFVRFSFPCYRCTLLLFKSVLHTFQTPLAVGQRKHYHYVNSMQWSFTFQNPTNNS